MAAYSVNIQYTNPRDKRNPRVYFSETDVEELANNGDVLTQIVKSLDLKDAYAFDITMKNYVEDKKKHETVLFTNIVRIYEFAVGEYVEPEEADAIVEEMKANADEKEQSKFTSCPFGAVYYKTDKCRSIYRLHKENENSINVLNVVPYEAIYRGRLKSDYIVGRDGQVVLSPEAE